MKLVKKTLKETCVKQTGCGILYRLPRFTMGRMGDFRYTHGEVYGNRSCNNGRRGEERITVAMAPGR